MREGMTKSISNSCLQRIGVAWRTSLRHTTDAVLKRRPTREGKKKSVWKSDKCYSTDATATIVNHKSFSYNGFKQWEHMLFAGNDILKKWRKWIWLLKREVPEEAGWERDGGIVCILFMRCKGGRKEKQSCSYYLMLVFPRKLRLNVFHKT